MMSTLLNLFSKPKPTHFAYNGTHTSPVKTPTPTFRPFHASKPHTHGILKLPPEILLEIFTFALTNNDAISRLYHPSNIGKTCRRFHEVLLAYIYRECKMVFQYSSFGEEPGCIYSRDKLELFRHYGGFVRKLSLISDRTLLPASTHLIRLFQWAPSLPSALFDLTPSFTLLTSLEFDGKFDNSVHDLVASLQYLLTNCLSLQKLALSVSVKYGVFGPGEVYDRLNRVIKMEQCGRNVLKPTADIKNSISSNNNSNNDSSGDYDDDHNKEERNKEEKEEEEREKAVTYAQLEELKLTLTEEGVNTAPHKLKRYQLLEVISLILKPATKQTKYLYFNIPHKGLEEYYETHRAQIDSERRLFLEFPSLRRLDISAAPAVICAFERFVKVDLGRVGKVGAMVDFRHFDKIGFSLFTKRFTALQTLTIINLQELLTNPPASTPATIPFQPWYHTSPWQYLKSSIILSSESSQAPPPSLKLLKIAVTGDEKSVIEEELGWEVTSRCAVEVRSLGIRATRETYQPFCYVKEGRWESWGVELRFF
ncbi:hypothetical protein TWF730_008831 [Orbilia blumenaviensis]|uniref:F-box domain-containing protein n=1 Tax=Orbilia blumenaviensis TaxID=1796055 RepID=A0AAV9V3M2_9PEZI